MIIGPLNLLIWGKDLLNKPPLSPDPVLNNDSACRLSQNKIRLEKYVYMSDFQYIEISVG